MDAVKSNEPPKAAEPRMRRPYNPPRILSRPLFERMALVCFEDPPDPKQGDS